MRLLLRAVLRIAAPRVAVRQIAGLERAQLARQAAALTRQRPAPPAPVELARAALIAQQGMPVAAARPARTARWEAQRVAAA